jgi:hypothetical protein
MTFTEIVQEVMSRLNLTSLDAETRIGQRVNDRYRRLTGRLGLITSRRYVTDVDLDGSDPSSTLPAITLDNYEKIIKVWTEGANGGINVLREITYDELSSQSTGDGTPRAWAVYRMGPGYVIIYLDSFEASTFTLHVEGYDVASELYDQQEPYFPTDFHYILIEGAMADELRKMEKPQLAQLAEQNFESGLSDLRMFIAKSTYLDIYQGKTGYDSRVNRSNSRRVIWWP